MSRDDAGERMSFFSHLEELRKRILWSVLAIGIGFIPTFIYSERIIKFLARPLPVKLAFLTPTEAFWVNMKVGMIAGLGLALPFVLYQVWAFVSPGLHRHERRYAAPFVIVGTLFFAIGAGFCLQYVIPFAVRFLLTYKTEDLTPVISIGSYVDFVLKFTLAFGLIFELPLAITLASWMGLVTPKFLAKNRKYALLINAMVAAMLTPTPDAFNMLLMLAPLCLLYELGIISARVFGRRSKAPMEESSTP
jgi:sec-independent protein translocase protein TatC